MKIETLTKEQEAAIIPFREKWIKRTLRTEKTDEEIKQGVKNLYKTSGEKEPIVFIMDSPFGAQVMVNFLRNLTKEQLEEMRLVDIKMDNIRINIGDNIRDNIWNNIGDNIESNIRNNIWSNIGDNIENNIGDNIRNNIRDNIWNNIRINIWSNIGDNIRDNIWNNKMEFSTFSSSDSSWVHWYLYQLYYFEVGLLKEDEYSKLLRLYIDDVIDSWMCIYLKNVAVVSRKPVVRREDERLHSDQLPAVLFPDGYEIYFLDGVEFPKETWQRVVSKEMSLSEIMKIEISDQRTVALKYNPQAIIKEKAKLVHKSERGNELYLVKGSEINTLTSYPEMYFLKMTCPTGRVFIEGVEPEFAKNHQNADECQAELCGLVLSEYMSLSMES